MITGEIKNRIDSIWDVFWTGGITNSITILEQMTYLFFMKMLDDAQRTKEANANAFGVAVKDPTFKEGMWHNPETDKDVPYNSLRWSTFKNMEAEAMYKLISKDVFVFIKNLNDGKEFGVKDCTVNGGKIVSNFYNGDNGDKVGGVVGGVWQGGATISGNKASNLTVQGYRHVGGVIDW